jgi:hypothetical protein
MNVHHAATALVLAWLLLGPAAAGADTSDGQEPGRSVASSSGSHAGGAPVPARLAAPLAPAPHPPVAAAGPAGGGDAAATRQGAERGAVVREARREVMVSEVGSGGVAEAPGEVPAGAPGTAMLAAVAEVSPLAAAGGCCACCAVPHGPARGDVSEEERGVGGDAGAAIREATADLRAGCACGRGAAVPASGAEAVREAGEGASAEAMPAVGNGGGAEAVPAAAAGPGEPAPGPADEVSSLLARIEPKGRFLAGVESSERDDYGRRYGVQQARLGLAFREGPVRAEVEADLAETQVLNDAWLEYRAGEWGRGRLGRFKAPFSGFLLSSAWDRPVLRRAGLPKAVRDLGFGGREIGARATYEAKSLGHLEVDLGLFQGAVVGVDAAQEDGYARITVAPWKPLRFGASAGRRAVFDGGAGDALGLDARLVWSGVTARLEGLWAENGITGVRVSGGIGHVAYRFPVSGRTWLEPGLEAEVAKHDDLDPRSTWAATLGAGWGERFLVRAGVEHGPTDPGEPASTAVLLQAGVQL